MSIQPVQDTIQFVLSAEETVTNDTVKVVASIVALVTHDMTEQKLKDSIRQLTQRFIKAEWNFSNMTRSNHAAGLEQITLTATARVPESENYGLDRRRVEASVIEGMTIASHNTDTSPTTAQIEQAQSKLRLTILRKAEAERQTISDTLAAIYRLGSVSFNEGHGTQSNLRGGMVAMSASAYGSGFGNDDADEDAIGNAVKLVMQATVQLRISR